METKSDGVWLKSNAPGAKIPGKHNMKTYLLNIRWSGTNSLLKTVEYCKLN